MAKSTRSRPTYEDIARRAYEIYVSEGCPEGRAAEHWLAAEQSLGVKSTRRAQGTSSHRPVTSGATGPRKAPTRTTTTRTTAARKKKQ